MKFYGQFEPPVDKFIFEHYFPSADIKGIFVECGAFDGVTECSCKSFEEYLGWTGFNIEPVPWIFQQLCKNRPQSRNLNFALSNATGKATFKAVNHPQFGSQCTNGSLSHTTLHERWLSETGCTLVDVEVNLYTWKDFIANEGIHHVDLLVLDVEGHEPSVLDGMKGCPVLPDLICIEVGHLPFSNIREQLAQLGYVYDISSHVNAFFIRESALTLFALRRANNFRSIDNNTEDSRSEMFKQIALLEDELSQIKKSRAWRLIEQYRRLKSVL
jgi:FkbM family methyltransferase